MWNYTRLWRSEVELQSLIIAEDFILEMELKFVQY